MRFRVSHGGFALACCMLLALHVACGADPVTVSLDATAWQTITTGQVPLTNNPDGTLTFVFPDASDGTMNYLYTLDTHTVSGLESLLADVTITALSGEPVFVYNTTGNPCLVTPHVRLFMFARSGSWYDQYARWWSNPLAHELLPGTFRLQTPLNDPSQWSSVYGASGTASTAALQGFTRTKKAAYLGMTFGGGCYFGHGVSTAGGTMEFKVLMLGVE